MDQSTESFLVTFNSIDFHQIKDHPNILIAAAFWGNERYGAAKTCYRFMRRIDDLIDDHKARYMTIAPEEKNSFTADVNEWLETAMAAGNPGKEHEELVRTIERFRLPLWPLQAFAKSMIWDIDHNGFPSVESFIDYAQGASVAPASIFVHLCGLIPVDGVYSDPPFNVREAATPCAIFSYLVHIIRDFQKDQLNNLNYFADDLIEANGLTKEDLRQIARGKEVTPGFRNLILEYWKLADGYRKKSYECVHRLRPLVSIEYQ
ncbi:MAG: squalene/phytoene synthase family protein, partial [Bacteroidales bacterium]